MESDLVKSLIINLIDNAKKAIDDSGNILVVGRLTEEGCLITVADTGRGMKPEELSRITEAFYRVDKSRSRAQAVPDSVWLCVRQSLNCITVSLFLRVHREKAQWLKLF